MDPLTAIGLAGSIVNFIDFGYKVVSGVSIVLNTPNGTTPNNQSLNALVEDLNAVTASLMMDFPAKTENDKQLSILAANCHRLSAELYQILRRLRVGDKTSKWEGLMVMWNSMRKGKEIESIERRLNGYQSQILMRLHIMLSQKTDERNSRINTQLEAALSQGRILQNRTTSHLDELLQTILTLVTSLQSSASNEKPCGSEQGALAELTSTLSEFQDMTSSLSRENKILEQLAFPSMYTREGNIETPESGTFAWMVDEKYQPTDDVDESPKDTEESIERHQNWEKRRLYHKEKRKQEILRQNTRETFLTWIDSGRHVFHISGKAGSGKSTLMKFLSKSQRVEKGLKSWSGDNPLVFAQFFFWNSGDEKQMSLEGLYRSLLFESCRQMPSLMPRLFPESWENPHLGVAPIPFDTVREAFDRLIREASTSTTHFCFFIDGLDEFQGDEVDHWRLSRDLQTWTTNAENIKLCVSSRPHIPFVQSFAGPSNIQISIHDHTREDIFRFSASKFEKDPNFHRVKDTYEDLVIEIVDAGDGVFLWARLVVRSLLKTIGYQGSQGDLKKKLHAMPKRLDELFDQILSSIDPEDQLLSDKLFLLTIPNFCRWQPTIRNAISYSWLGELDNPNFPYEFPMKPCTESEIDKRLERVSCELDRFSRGLLEISRRRSRDSDGHDYFTHEVRFLHRSAREYIVNTREAKMRARLPDLDIYSGIIRLLLAEMKFAKFTTHDSKPRTWATVGEGGPIRSDLDIFFTIISAANDLFGYDPSPRFFDEACKIIQHHSKPAELTSQDDPENSIPEPKGHIFGNNMQRVGDEWSVQRASNHPPDFLCEALNRNAHRFLSSDLKSSLKMQNSISGPNLLLTSAWRSNDVSFLRELLREGRSPLEMIDMEPIRPHGRPDMEGYITIPAPQPKFSIWLVFIYTIVEHYLLTGSADKEESQILQEFLKFDVNCDIMFIVRILRSSNKINQSAINDEEPRESEESNDADERVVFEFQELLEFLGPSNLDTLQQQILTKLARQDRLAVTPVSGPPVPYQRGSLAKTIEDIVLVGNKSRYFGFGTCVCVESVITPFERLDAPFAFRVT